MNQKDISRLQSTGTNQLQQLLSHLTIPSSAEGNPICQACGEPIIEGDPITVYLYCPAGSTTYTVGQCRCSTHNENLIQLFTLGVAELIVDGRIGSCRDHATQQTWSVLIEPTIRLISASATTSGRLVTPTDVETNNLREAKTTDSNTVKSKSDTPSEDQTVVTVAKSPDSIPSWRYTNE